MSYCANIYQSILRRPEAKETHHNSSNYLKTWVPSSHSRQCQAFSKGCALMADGSYYKEQHPQPAMALTVFRSEEEPMVASAAKTLT